VRNTVSKGDRSTLVIKRDVLNYFGYRRYHSGYEKAEKEEIKK